MNNKVLWLILLLCVAWMAKLSLDVYTLRGQSVQLLQERVEQQTQRIAKLNDQLTALQAARVDQTQSQTIVKDAQLEKEKTLPEETYSAQNYVYDRLQLIHSLLQQQYLSAALEQTQNLKKQLIEQTLLSSSLNQTLVEALSKDQVTITSYIQERSEHLQILQQQLQKIEQALQVKPLTSNQNKWQISTWFSLSKANQIPELYQRNMYFKQLQLQVLLAQQALYAGETTFYHAQLQEIVEGLSRYPDSTARSIVAQIQRLDTRALSQPPQLSALSLVLE